MTEEEKKYTKKRNTLIYIAMALLVIFVALICYIVVYSKMNPPKEYVSPDTIVVNKLNTMAYQVKGTPKYKEIVVSTEYIVKKDNNDYSLVLEDNTLKVKENDLLSDIVVRVNDDNINGKIKLVYQSDDESLILTTDGLLYRPLDNVLSLDNTISVGQILSNENIKSIVEVNMSNYTYILSVDNKIISTNDGMEYDGIINVLECDGGNLFVYEDYSIGFDKGMVFVNNDNTSVKLNILYSNILIDINGNVFDLDFINKTMSNSKLGVMSKIAYNRDSNNVYTIGLETNTGNYSAKSNYYYMK